MSPLWRAGALLLVLLTACSGGNPTVARGLPQVAIEFPQEVRRDSLQTALLRVTNPGPEEMRSLFVSFTLVGVARQEDVPRPLVPPGFKHKNPAIVRIEPKPRSVSLDGWVYRFPGLPVGESATLRFAIKTPVEPGVAANAVTVYDGSDVSRARGVSLQTTIRR